MVSPEPGARAHCAGTPSSVSSSGSPEPAATRASSDQRIPGAMSWDNPNARFILPAGILFVVCCLAIPAWAGYRPHFMETRVGPFHLGGIVALAQFFMAWITAALYVRTTNIFDRDARAILDDTHHREIPEPHPTRSRHQFSRS